MFEWLLKWYPLILIVISALSAYALLWMRGQFVSKEEFNAVADAVGKAATHSDVENLTTRVIELEKKVPDTKALTDLALRAEKLQGQIDTLEAQLEGFSSLMKRVETQVHLLLENELRG